MVSSTPDWRTMPWHLSPILTVQVLGLPVPQGSIRSLGKGRPSVHSNADRLLPWRDRVQTAFEDAKAELDMPWPLLGPIAVIFAFTMAKPKSAPKRRRTWPISRPDWDKLARAGCDAIQNAGIIKDDSQIIDAHVRKVFPLEHSDALTTPGLYATLCTIDDAALSVDELHALPRDLMSARVGILDLELPDVVEDQEEADVPW